MNEAHCSVQRLFPKTPAVRERHTHSIDQNEKILLGPKTQCRFLDKDWDLHLPELSLTLPKSVQAQTWQVALKVNMYIQTPYLGHFLPIIRLLQRLYSCVGKCITQFSELCKHGISLGLSGQGNFPVFPATRGQSDGNQTSKDFGILPFQRCLDEEKR